MSQGHIRSILPQKGGVAPVDNNTVALFPFDQHAGDVIRGIKSFGNTKAVSFSGATGSYADFGNFGLSSLSNCTVEFWHKTSSAANWLLFRGQAGNYYIMAISPTGTFYHASGGSPTIYCDGVVATKLIRDGQWHHYAAVGVNLSTWTQVTMSNYSSFEIHGSMENLRVWPHALTQDEVKMSMHGGVSGKATLAHWKFDEGEGNLLFDASGNGHDGILYGGSWAEGRSTYSFAKDTPRNGGVLIEEETTNLFGGPYTTVHTNGTGTIEQLADGWTKLTYGGGTNTYTYTRKSITVTGISTFSLMVRNNVTGNFRLRIEGGSRIKEFSLDGMGGERRISFTANSDSTMYDIIMGDFYGIANTVPYLEFTAVQVEQKAYPTSFVDGSRKRGSLKYPKELINPNVFTFSAWVNLSQLPSTTGLVSSGMIPIFEIARAIEPTNRLIFGWFGGNDLSVWKSTEVSSGNGGIRTNHILTSSDVGVWHMYTLTFDGTIYKIYADGKLVGGQNMATATFHESATLSIGGDIHGVLNGTVSELRIDKVARTAEEIEAWYYQGRNGW